MNTRNTIIAKNETNFTSKTTELGFVNSILEFNIKISTNNILVIG